MKADRVKFETEQELQEEKLNTVIKDESDAMEMYAVSYISSLKMANESKPLYGLKKCKTNENFSVLCTRYTKAQDRQEKALDDMGKVGFWGTLIGRR